MSKEDITFDFERLDVYKEACEGTVDIIKIVEKLPHRLRWKSDQLRRAADSIVLNIAEGNGRVGQRDRMHFFRIAQGSVNECVAGVEVAHRLDGVSDKNRLQLRRRLFKVSQMLSGMVRGLKASRKAEKN